MKLGLKKPEIIHIRRGKPKVGCEYCSTLHAPEQLHTHEGWLVCFICKREHGAALTQMRADAEAGIERARTA